MRSSLQGILYRSENPWQESVSASGTDSAASSPLQYSELVAQDQDLRGLPCLLTPG